MCDGGAWEQRVEYLKAFNEPFLEGLMLQLYTALLLQIARPSASMATGNEWMIIASVVIPAVLVVVLIYLGSRNTV